MGVEKRRYPRVEITWPVTVITPNGPKGGRIQNIGFGGALIQRTKAPELDGFFRLVIKATESHFIFATAEMVWSDTFFNDKSRFHEMGVNFCLLLTDNYTSHIPAL
jgi:hypothetical protein